MLRIDSVYDVMYVYILIAYRIYVYTCDMVGIHILGNTYLYKCLCYHGCTL